MNDFTASNGVQAGAGHTFATFAHNDEHSTVYIGPENMTALREFFRAEEDERLGRWRSGHFLVYPDRDYPGDVMVVDERTPDEPFRYARESVSFDGEAGAAALGYFAAHPEPKPWHDAKPDEVWVVEGRPRGVVERANEPHTFVDPAGRNPGFPVTSPEIRTATRIWPAVTQ